MAEANKTSVLLCDDMPDIVDLVSVMIGLEADLELVGTAADGVEAVERTTTLEPDVVVLDVAMPRMDGLEALTLIREQRPNQAVVMHTAFNDPDLARRAMQRGAASVVVKGTSPRRLLDAVRQAAPRPPRP